MKKLISLILLTLLLINPINVFSENNRIVDEANKLTDYEIQELTSQLDELSDKYDFDIVIYLTTDTSFGDDIVSQGCEFYDNNNYGYGDDHRGILLIVNYEQGVFDVITTGDEVREKYDGYIVDCYDAIQNSLGNNPYEAIQIFEYWIDTRFISENDDINESYTTEPINKNVEELTISGIISTIISTIVGFVLKGQLKTEGKKKSASNYINKNSFKLTRSGDIFLYRTTTRRKINNRTNNNNQNNFHNSGGTGFHISHTSSSGISHGSGGGRKF